MWTMEADLPVFDALHRNTKALSVALGYRDLLTRRHSERVHGLSKALGVRLRLSQQELAILDIAATFHDIGKIGIPDRILEKPSRLDEDERETMNQHATIGEKIIAATELEGSQEAARIIRHHHEHYDGFGYPDKLGGERIPICSRIISITDSYDAMAVTRSYHKARTHREIMAILDRETGTKHDPELMLIFCEVIETSIYIAANS
jgi:response regulator RpfG family c-di-GMP phosphodiesterase